MTQDRYRNLHRVRDILLAESEGIIAVAGQDIGFSMSSWVELDGSFSCGTAACIGGTAELLIREERGLPTDVLDVREALDDHTSIPDRDIAEWMGITTNTAESLFYGYPWTQVTPADGVKAIDDILAGREPWTTYRKERDDE